MDWKGKQLVILGAARQGGALAAYAAAQGAKVRLSDSREAAEFGELQQSLQDFDIEWRFGQQDASLLKRADMLSLSGGVSPELPLVKEAQRKGIAITNDSQLFLESAPCPVVGITGSAGKTTTTILIGRILNAMMKRRAAGRAWVGGNIGNPLISHVGQMAPMDLAVMELSSFQLELMSRSPQIALVLNIAPNHLDRHATMADYVAAKARILDFQNEGDRAILSRDDLGSWGLVGRVKGELWSFGRETISGSESGTFLSGKDIWLRDERGESKLLPIAAIALRGEHNLNNVLAACAVAASMGAQRADMLEGLEHFTGAPHRLEFVRSVAGAEWFNDSIATSPQRAEASLRSFERPIILLAGGRDKDLNWERLGDVAVEKCRAVVAFGEAGGLIEEVFGRHLGSKTSFERAENLEEAVAQAAKLAGEGDVVLLAPGGTSFDEFVDFEARGKRFVELVNEL